MRSSKSRSRNKSNRQRSLGNVINRVFDSSGPEGKVRGTPQQIIDKYLTLARDAQLSNDRVAEQSFFQHAEHYTRMLGEAQRENAERQAQHQNQPAHNQRQNGDDDRDGNGGRDHVRRDNREPGGREQAGREYAQHDSSREAEADSASDADQPAAEAPAPAEPPRRGRPRRSAQDSKPQPDSDPANDDRPQPGLPDVVASEGEDGPVATPEAEGAKKPRAKTTRARSATPRTRRKPASGDEPGEGSADTVPGPQADSAEQG